MWDNTWGGASTTSWDAYSGYFSKFEGMFAMNEKRREIKKKIKNKALETYTPLTVRTNDGETRFHKKRKMTIDISTKEIDTYKKDDVVDKIMKVYDRIPFNSDMIDNAMAKKWLNPRDKEVERFIDESVPHPKAFKSIDAYFKGDVTYKEVKSLFRKPEQEEKERWNKAIAQSLPTEKDDPYVRGTVPKSLYDRALKLIRSKIKMRDVVETEENMRKGKRINRSFINKTSYKPLISKTVEAQKKKKLFILIDGSGSMNGKPADEAGAFAAGLVDSGEFDVKHVVWHNTGGWKDVAEEIKRGKRTKYIIGGEGFGYLEDNLPREFVDGVDYVLVLTDLCIDESSQQGLYDFIKHKRNMILSFQQAGTLKGLNVRQIKEGKDMVNALTTLVN